ncbi:hypothetical protein R3P38DRAFT_3283758 [Favolaschia claudopus]|uniref:Uncharacterized protein n=1 Tax=Favolaschia claudopus TaxID=2862362 RepID=A0AAW0A7A1_9AGAR
MRSLVLSLLHEAANVLIVSPNIILRFDCHRSPELRCRTWTKLPSGGIRVCIVPEECSFIPGISSSMMTRRLRRPPATSRRSSHLRQSPFSATSRIFNTRLSSSSDPPLAHLPPRSAHLHLRRLALVGEYIVLLLRNSGYALAFPQR